MTESQFKAAPWQSKPLPSGFAWSVPSIGVPTIAWSFQGQGQLAFQKQRSVVVLTFSVFSSSTTIVQGRVEALARQMAATCHCGA
jgi:hypothetical protein